MIELAAFFGNLGTEYSGNRHNAGWHLAGAMPFRDQLNWQNKFKGRWAAMESSVLASFCSAESPAAADEQKPDSKVPEKIHFLKPGTFMNNSGDSVYEAASFFKIKPENIIVIHDELELALGTVSLKFGGGLGGHNGLRSMKARFGTADFWRLRIGIGRPDDRLPGQGGPQGSGRGIVEWVLSDFSREESAVLEPVLHEASNLLLEVLVFGPEKFLPLWAKKKIEYDQ
ncbi:MAG: aminoacyl-tRNA hydrolase [Treponema sp.]|nr:aminoacyl-tRNA hydrolase [Treponema sp.]